MEGQQSRKRIIDWLQITSAMRGTDRAISVHSVRLCHLFRNVPHDAAFRVAGQQLCVYSVVMKSEKSMQGPALFSSYPVLRLKWQAVPTWPCEPVQSTPRVEVRGANEGRCAILYLWICNQPWLTTWDSREVHPPCLLQALRLSHTQAAVTNTHPHEHQVKTSYL